MLSRRSFLSSLAALVAAPVAASVPVYRETETMVPRTGGEVAGWRPYLIAERGPEAFVPHNYTSQCNNPLVDTPCRVSVNVVDFQSGDDKTIDTCRNVFAGGLL